MNFKQPLVLVISLLLASIPTADARSTVQAITIFKGIPTIKISEGGIDRSPEMVGRDKAVNLACVISKIGDDYYWATRENRQAVAIEKRSFITFVAVDGSGYVRIVAPCMKKMVSLMGDTEDKFDYVEHLLIGLKSVTYYGTTAHN